MHNKNNVITLMKKTLPLLFVSLLALPFCTKEDGDGMCWKCTTTITSSVPNYPTSKVETTVCNKTGREIIDFQKEMTTKTTSGNVTVTQTMNCKQQ